MSPLSESPDTLPVGSTRANDFARQLAGFSPGALRLLLQALQQRRGTAAERAGDAEQVDALGYEIDRRVGGALRPDGWQSSRVVGA